MRAQVSLGRVFGFQIGLHYSWLILAFLVMLSAQGYLLSVSPGWPPALYWALSLATALLFFVCLILHELSHALVARARGMEVTSITLFALGGVAGISRDTMDAKTEFWMGIVGPATSFAIGLVCQALALAMGPGVPVAHPVQAMLTWLATVNMAVAVFNLLPGFPLDGGRILRAAAWRVTKDHLRATRIAARSGQVLAHLFVFFGLWRAFTGGGFGGIWMVFLGWFLLEAATASLIDVQFDKALAGLSVCDVMSRDYPVVDGAQDLKSFVADLLRTGRRCFVVEEKGQPAGIITTQEVRSVEPSRWMELTVDDVMRPLQRLITVRPAESLLEALRLMGREDVNQLPVMSDGRLEGMISRGQIMQTLQTRREIPA